MAAGPSEPDASQEPPAAPNSNPNPCCAKLWKKFQKVETSRNALREAVKILQKENEKLQKENSDLSRACKEERLRGDSAEAARETESAARDMLEKEIIELKTEKSTLQQTQSICKNENELLHISELEEENGRLKQVLGEERKRTESEKKRAEEEKKRGIETQKLLKSETIKSEEYRKLADTERKLANELKASFEKLRNEANETRTQLVAQIQKTEEAHKRAEAEKQNAAREKKHVDSEKLVAKKNKKLIEVARKKVMEEKSRGDSLSRKLEVDKKLFEDLRISIETERKNVMVEKNRADHLLQKLEEERKRSECFQRKADDICVARNMISFGKHGNQHPDIITESATVKLLKEKLKLKKGQLKHVKNVSRLDKAKNSLIRQELQHLKQDWMQLLRRFNMLDNHLAGGVEGVDDLTKLKQQSKMHGCEQKLLPQNPVTGSFFELQTGMAPFSSCIPRECTTYQLPRGSCTRPTSGTSSELEPPVGSSVRTKSKSCDKSLCPTFISDKKFMGSQGKDSLFVSSSASLRKNQSSTIVELSPKDSKDVRKENGRALIEISRGSFRQKASKTCMSGGTETVEKAPNGGRKRKGTKISMESAAWLCSEHGSLHSKMKEKDSTLNGPSAFKANCSCPQQAKNVSDLLCETEDDLGNYMSKCHVVGDKVPCFSGPTQVPSPGAGNAFMDGSKFSALLSFEEMIRGDCLKLLSLDNAADEEKYRTAMETPLSPDLPNILHSIYYDESHCLVDGTVNKSEYERDRLVSRFDVIDLEISSNLLEAKELAVQKPTQNNSKLEPSFNRVEGIDSVKKMCANSKSNAAVNVSCNAKLVDAQTETSFHCILHDNEASNTIASHAVEPGNISRSVFSRSSASDAPNQSNTHQILDASSDPVLQTIVGTNKTQAAKPINLTSTSMIGHHHGAEITPMCIVGPLRMERTNIIRTFHYWETLISDGRKLSKEALVDGSLLERVSSELLLLPEEKVCLIFSFLLWDICCRVVADPITDGNFASSAVSLTVKSDMETRWAFLKTVQVDVLVSLIEDFLLNREVVVCDNMGCGMSSDSSKCYNLDGTGIQVATKSATTDQFISGCILLALICGEVERMDVLLEVSYKVLQIGRSNLSCALLALHVFASVCGKTLLFPDSCNSLATTVRLVVLLLEGMETSLSLVSSHVQSNRQTAFSPCAQCPFDGGSVSISGFISYLLDELELCSLLCNNHANSNESIARCNRSSKLGLVVNCGESCNIYKQAKLAEDSPNDPAGGDLCYCNEIISLLELFGSYMSCEWTYNNVIVRLLKILELCRCDGYSAAVLVLVGHLGRFFIEDGGYEQKAVNEMKNRLSEMVGTRSIKSRSIPVQFAAIGAYLSLLPLTFDKLVDPHAGPLCDPSLLQARHISDWFAQLSKEHQSLAYSFLS